MATRFQLIARQLAPALALAALVIGCGRHHPQIDSSTNWLQACESSAECGELSCLCGVCNATCSSDVACSGLDSDAECSAQAAQSANCAGMAENVCILRCSDDGDCRDGLTCSGGLCGEAMASAPSGNDAGPAVAADAATNPVDASGNPDYGFDFTQIAVGGRHTCGLVRDGSMLCWGSNYYGALAGADDPAADFTQLAAGGYHTCGLRRDRSLACWGMGNLEVGQVSGPNADPSTDFIHIAAGNQHTCALRSDGSIICWGEDNYGQVSGPNGDGSTDFIQLTGGTEHTCALRMDRSMICWGRDLYDEVSGPNNEASPDFLEIAAGDHHTCALRAGGNLKCWGNGEQEDEVSGPNRYSNLDLTHVMTAAYQTCALHDDRTITCWGADWDGQVSGANASNVADFIQLSGSIEADGNHLCALSIDGTVQCWGNDGHGQLSGLDELALQPR
jgi:alpha-tubulin suppressor-like RCC1 family protein